MKKVSVIVPVYNVEKYLPQCLDSLVNQTLRDIEILVVNDGSPDNSQAIIDAYREKYPELIRSYMKENRGQGSARNLGLSHADGEYISFIDSDDWIDRDALKSMYELAEKESSDIVICDMADHFEDGSVRNYNCTKYDSVYAVTPSASNKIFRRTAIGDLRFLEDIWYEDFDFTTKLLLKKPRISVISKTFYHCNCREDSTMNNNNSRKNLDMITVIDDLRKYAKDNNCWDENVMQFLIFHHILITTVNRVAAQTGQDRKPVLKELTAYCREYLNDYTHRPFYQNVPVQRKMVAFLNYHGLYGVSQFLLRLKAGISGR